MELLLGESVESLWERLDHKVPLPLVAGIGLQLLDVLASAHAHQLVHRDIKPANLMLTRDGQVKVLDFGIARLRDVAHVRATQTGTALGTPAFMAPEHAMAQAEEIDAQTDVWAAGATLFTLASGHLVHDADNAQQIMILSATKPARSFATVLPDAPAAIVEVIDRALSFHKSERWASAAAMREALRAAATEAFGAAPTAATMSEMVDELRPDEATAERMVPVDARDGPTSPGAAPVDARVGRRASAVSPVRPPPSAGRGSAPAIGFITDEAVSTEPKIIVRVRRPGRIAAAAGVAALVVLGGVAAIVRPGGPAPQATTVRSAARTPVPLAPSSTVPAEPSSSPFTPVPADSNPLPSIRASDLPTAPPRVPPPVAANARPHPAAPATAAAAPTASSKPSCNPPYEFDAKGDKRWKRECL
jgi:serine/threonine-protein kinase